MDELKKTIINTCDRITQFKKKTAIKPSFPMDVEIFGILQEKHYGIEEISKALNELYTEGKIKVSKPFQYKVIWKQ